MPERVYFLIKLLACNFIKKETLAQVFSSEFFEISKNKLFREHLRWLLLKIMRMVLFNFFYAQMKFQAFNNPANSVIVFSRRNWITYSVLLCCPSHCFYKVNAIVITHFNHNFLIINLKRPSVQKMVKHTFKTFQHLMQDF